jgi:hypothetical protein
VRVSRLYGSTSALRTGVLEELHWRPCASRFTARRRLGGR